MKRYTFDRVARLLISVVIVVGLLWVMSYLREVLLPFVIAFLGAYLLQPVVCFMQRHGVKNRLLAVLVTLLLLVGIIVGAFFLLTPPLIRQGQHLGKLLSKLVQDKNITDRITRYVPDEWLKTGRDFFHRPEVVSYLQDTPFDMTPEESDKPAPVVNTNNAENSSAPVDFATADTAPQTAIPQTESPLDADVDSPAAPVVDSSWWEDVKSFFASSQMLKWVASEKFMETAKEAAKRVLPIVAHWFSNVFSSIVNILLGIAGATLMILYLIYILRDYDSFRNNWQGLIPPAQRATVSEFFHDFDHYMSAYFRAQSLISFCSGIVMAIGFQIIGLPFGILLGLFCGLLSMVPYLQAVGFIPAAILALIYSLDTGASFFWIAAEIAVVFAVAQLIYDLVLIPKFMGDATKLSPAVILLSLSIWWKLLGVLGFFIALPMTCIILVYYRRLINRHNSPLNLTGEPHG